MSLVVTSVPVKDLHTYHKNPRRGKVPAIEESLNVNGQYKPIVVNVGTYTGRPEEVLAGNHTLIAARNLGWDSIAVVHVDVDEDAAARIVLVDNRIGELGESDPDDVMDLLKTLESLEGTGYTQAELDELNKIENEAHGDAGVDELPTTWGVIVRCDNEDQQQRLLEQLAEEGFDVRALIT
jgi:ParB-like chromosome segregation protein Spo0J